MIPTLRALLPYFVVAAILGAGLISGLLAAFSNFLMRALRELRWNHLRSALGALAIVLLAIGLVRP